jgi:hypothetical protein
MAAELALSNVTSCVLLATVSPARLVAVAEPVALMLEAVPVPAVVIVPLDVRLLLLVMSTPAFSVTGPENDADPVAAAIVMSSVSVVVPVAVSLRVPVTVVVESEYDPAPLNASVRPLLTAVVPPNVTVGVKDPVATVKF